MSSEQSSADVADDYRAALEDLNSINRADISTLTTIARENTEHAQAITEALQKHIVKAPAHKKLPAIYVLDSIVKNVGTPYTLFFGAQLYSTFMEAYAAVDSHVRRKMEETLQTWKQPVPSSLDDRPVFPPDVTQPIEDALNKARSSALALQAQGSRQGYNLGRARAAGLNRATPTPPGMPSGSAQPGYLAAPPHTQQPNGSRPSSAQPQHQQHQRPAQAANPHQPPHSHPGQYGPQHPQPGPYQLPLAEAAAAGPQHVDVNSLYRDIEELIEASRIEASQNPYDQGVQQRLKGLQDLQMLLQTQSVPQDQLVLVRNQVADLAVKVRPYPAQSPAAAAPYAAAAAAAPTPVPSYHTQTPSQPPNVIPPSASSAAPAPQHGSVTLDALLGQGALAALMSRQSATPQPQPQAPAPTPPPQQPPMYGSMPLRSPQPPPAEPARQSSAAPASDPAALLAGLRKAGLLAATPTQTPPSAPPPAPSAPTGATMPPPGVLPPGVHPPPPGALPSGIASLLAPQSSDGLSLQARIMDTITLDAGSLKNEFRPHLLPSLHEALGPQCTQCGRRFAKDDEGRKKKTAHMDWHFQAHHRLAEAERRGQHRSWYVDSADWVKSREDVDAEHTKEGSGSGGASGTGRDGDGEGTGQKGEQGAAEARLRYIAVPDASAGVNGTCPICQEKFENKWLDAAQEWVWLDATLVGGNKAYHASCYAEATRATRDGTPGTGASRATPEPVLGKRKAEDELKNLRKVKMDA